MQRYIVYLVTSGECGWASVRQTLKKLPGGSVLEEPSVRRTIHAVREDWPHLLLVSPDKASMLLTNQAQIITAGTHERIRFAIIGSRPPTATVPHHPCFELAGYLLWHDLNERNLGSLLTTLLDTHLLLVSPEVSDRLVEVLRPTFAGPPLTDRDRLVVRRLAEGLSDREIIQHESMGERTVERVVGKLSRAFGVRSRFALGVEVVRRGVLDPSGK